jgi:hypothetical protein
LAPEALDGEAEGTGAGAHLVAPAVHDDHRPARSAGAADEAGEPLELLARDERAAADLQHPGDRSFVHVRYAALICT